MSSPFQVSNYARNRLGHEDGSSVEKHSFASVVVDEKQSRLCQVSEEFDVLL